MDTNHGIFFESTESYEASQAIQQMREDLREDDRRAVLVVWALCAVMFLGSCALAYMWTKVPAAYDAPAAMEVVR